MSRVFIFPGQGSQAIGMAGALAESFPVAANTLAEADDALGFALSDMMREGPEETLNSTEFTQPALVAASIAAWRVYRDAGGAVPVAAAGHSLGEYSALVAAGVLEFADAVKLVHARGKFMQGAAPEGAGGMAAIIGLDLEAVETACRAAVDAGHGAVQPANINAPGQIVIAGEKGAVDAACGLAKAAGAKRALPLKVSVAAHSAMMEPAVAPLTELLLQTNISTPKFPVLHNSTLATAASADEIREALAKQLVAPVNWIGTVERLVAEYGATELIECGPGAVLAGLVKRIAPGLPVHPLGLPEQVAALA